MDDLTLSQLRHVDRCRDAGCAHPPIYDFRADGGDVVEGWCDLCRSAYAEGRSGWDEADALYALVKFHAEMGHDAQNVVNEFNAWTCGDEAMRTLWFEEVLRGLDFEVDGGTWDDPRWAWQEHPWFVELGLTFAECEAALDMDGAITEAQNDAAE